MGWVEVGSGRSDGGGGPGESGPRGLVRIPATTAGCRAQRQPQHSRDAGPEGEPVGTLQPSGSAAQEAGTVQALRTWFVQGQGSLPSCETWEGWGWL